MSKRTEKNWKKTWKNFEMYKVGLTIFHRKIVWGSFKFVVFSEEKYNTTLLVGSKPGAFKIDQPYKCTELMKQFLLPFVWLNVWRD